MPSRKKSPAKPKARRRVQAVVKPQRIGIFGGTFDPFHLGHLNSVKTILRKLKLAQVLVIPAYQSPLRKPVQGASANDRLEMVRAGVAELGDKVEVLDLEIQREGVSYTIDTLMELRKSRRGNRFTLILGLDQLAHFDQWRDYTQILTLTDLVVTSRPGHEFPKSKEELPAGLRHLVKAVRKGKFSLTTGHEIELVQLDDIEVSASEIRRRLREARDIQDLVPEAVAKFIHDRRLYQAVGAKIGDFVQFAKECEQILDSKGAIQLVNFDLRESTGPAEYVIVTSGTSTRHAIGLAESLVKEIKQRRGVYPQGVEGLKEGRWIVVDYGALMIHIFYDFVRQEYRLEELWGQTPRSTHET